MPRSPGQFVISLAFLLVLTACVSTGPDIAALGVAGSAPAGAGGGIPLEEVESSVSTIGDPAPDSTVDLTDQPEQLTAAATNEDRSNDPNRLICRKMQRVGTHRRVEVCYTAAELAAMQEATQEIMLNQNGVRPDAETLNRLEELGSGFPGGF